MVGTALAALVIAGCTWALGGDGMEEVGAPKKRKRKKGSKLRMPNSPDDVKDEM